jgi:hypothetical protein
MTGASERDQKKTRSLRKYEAEAISHVADGDAPRLDVFSPFGPMIAKAEIPHALVEKINRFADRHVREHEGSEFLLPSDLVGDGGEASLVRQTERQPIRRNAKSRPFSFRRHLWRDVPESPRCRRG